MDKSDLKTGGESPVILSFHTSSGVVRDPGNLGLFTLWLNKKKTIFLLMSIAFVIRAGFGVLIGERYLPMADQIAFDEMARNIASGKGLVFTDRMILPPEDMPEMREAYYTRPERIRDLRMNALWGIIRIGEPSAFFEPVIPLIYAGLYKVFGPTLIAPRIFQSLLEALVVWMIYSIGVYAFPRSRAPGIAALIYTFYPFTIMFSGALITQPIYLFLQISVIYVFYKFMQKPGWGIGIVLGFTLALTTLARVSIIAFAPFLILTLFFQKFSKPKWAPALVSLFIGGLLLIPWAVRNKNVVGEPIILPTKGGRNMWEYNNQIFSVEKRNLPVDSTLGTDLMYLKFALKNYDKIKGKQYIEFPEFTNESELERDRILNHHVNMFIALNPGIYIKLCFMRFYQFFRIVPSNYQHIFFKLAAFLSFGWILPMFILGMVLLAKHWKNLLPIYLLIFYNIGVHTLTASGIPHRLPLDPFLILFAAYTIHWLLVKSKVIELPEKTDA